MINILKKKPKVTRVTFQIAESGDKGIWLDFVRIIHRENLLLYNSERLTVWGELKPLLVDYIEKKKEVEKEHKII